MSNDESKKRKKQIKAILPYLLDKGSELLDDGPNRQNPDGAAIPSGFLGTSDAPLENPNHHIQRRLAEGNRDAEMMIEESDQHEVDSEEHSSENSSSQSIPPSISEGRISNVIPIKPDIHIDKYIPHNQVINHSHIKKIFTLHPDWQDVIRYDEYKDELIKFKPTPWGDVGSWTNVDTTQAKVWLGDHFSVTYPTSSLDEVLTVIGYANKVNTLQEELKLFYWDGVPRLNDWLIKFFNAEDTDYHKEIGKRYLLSAIARAMDPGCKADHVLILEGATAFQKSQAIKILAGQRNFCDSQIDLRSSFCPAQLVGVWIYELPERVIFKSFSNEETKAWLSKEEDHYAPKNQKRKIYQRRTNVFTTTTNESVYLNDAAGDRRSWPCKITSRINLENIYNFRENILAEAVHYYNIFRENNPFYPVKIDDPTYQWWLDEFNESIARDEQEKRYAAESWEEDITAWLAKNSDKILKKGYTTTSEVLQKALGKRKHSIDKDDEMKVARILTTRLNWRKGLRLRTDAGRIYPFYPPDY